MCAIDALGIAPRGRLRRLFGCLSAARTRARAFRLPDAKPVEPGIVQSCPDCADALAGPRALRRPPGRQVEEEVEAGVEVEAGEAVARAARAPRAP